MNYWRRFWSDTRGATSIEYGIIALLVTVAIVASVKVAGTNLSKGFSKAASGLS